MKKILLTLLCTGLVTCLFAQDLPWDVNGRGLSFAPDFTFKGSSLDGWKATGSSNWKAGNGQITVDPNNSTVWLASAKSFQDVAVNLLVKAGAGAEAGVLFRLERSDNGYKAILVSVKDGAAASYRIAFDLQGKELSREKLRPAGNIIRVAPPAPKNAPADRPAGNGSGGGRRSSEVSDLPMNPPSTAIIPGGWNQLEVIIDFNIIRKFVNDGGDGTGGATEDTDASFGPIALYASGSGQVSFKDIRYKDVAKRHTPKEFTSPNFTTQRISDMYYSWSASAADFNHDGVMDVVSGPYIYFGPEYTDYQEVAFAGTINPSREFTSVNCQYAFDFNGDGWADILTGPGAQPTLYLNPKDASRRWDKYQILQDDNGQSINIQSEITVFADIDGDKRPELVYANDRALWYAKFDPADPTKPWKQVMISTKGYALAHGIGTGDINGDGRIDIINPYGWWEQPAGSAGKEGNWTYHPEAFARYGHRSMAVGGSVMAVYDVNGDGLNDVVSILNAHGFGIGWFEQQRDKAGKITFVKHLIADDYATADKNAGGVTVSQMHGATFADIDGDGITDFIAGKRYWTHLDDYFDPDPYGDAVLYVFKTVRDKKAPGGARFIPELIHNRSGGGSDVAVADLNKDGAIDIISATNRGTFIFWNKGKKGKIVKKAK